MATEQRPSPPELKSINRVTSIPLVHDSLSVIHSTLQAWTPTAYGYGQAFGSTALNYSQPIQARLAPLLVSADGYAMKGLDVAQGRFPTPFTIKSEELSEQIKTRREHAYKSFTTPVTDLAHNVDSSLTPIVDRLEVAVHKFNKKEPSSDDASSSSSHQESTQVGRAYRLGVDFKDQIFVISNEQIKQLQSQSAVIQRAQESIHTLNATLSTSYTSAKDKSTEFVLEKKAATQEAAQHLLLELEKYQAMTMELPKQIQTSLKPVQEGIQASLTEISTIMKGQDPLGEKVTKVAKAVQDNIQPLLHEATVTVQDYIEQGKAYLTRAKTQTNEAVSEAASPNPTPNGYIVPE